MAMSDKPQAVEEIYPVKNNRIVKLHWAEKGYEPLCQEILERHENDTLEEMYIGSPKENYKKSFFVDIDNDGIDEELQYFSAYRYLTLAEIFEGKRSGFSSPSVKTAFYSGNYMVVFQGKNYLLHLDSRGPIEVQSVERMVHYEGNPPIGDLKIRKNIMCKYYEGTY